MKNIIYRKEKKEKKNRNVNGKVTPSRLHMCIFTYVHWKGLDCLY